VLPVLTLRRVCGVEFDWVIWYKIKIIIIYCKDSVPGHKKTCEHGNIWVWVRILIADYSDPVIKDDYHFPITLKTDFCSLTRLCVVFGVWNLTW
jgi:hypothetical protein